MSDLFAQIAANDRRLLKDMKKQTKSNDLEKDHRWADAVRRGCIFFYDQQEVFIGHRQIDWTGSHINHQEWPAQLNRFFCLKHLVAVTEAGEGDDLPALARGMIEDWIDQHDYSADAPPDPGDNLLNLSIRLGQSTGRGWWPAIVGLNSPDVFDEAFLKKVIESTRGQLDCERQYLTTMGNWRISQLDSLIYCGLVVPGLDQHLSFAIRMLNECFHRQMNPDGVHQEHCPGYHAWMCSVMTDYWRLSQARPELGLKIDSERLLKAWNYRVCSTLPDGNLSELNDTTNVQVGSLKTILDQREQILKESGLTGPEWDLEETPSHYFPKAGQIFLRTGWTPDDCMTVFDASRWYGWHSHLGRNSVNLFAGGSNLLPDPGIFSYHAEDPFAAYGRSTAAHNTVNLSLMNQSECNPDIKEVHLFRDMALVQSCYSGGYYPGAFYGNWLNGHQPGVFGLHDRTLLWLGKAGCLVWDYCKVDQAGQKVNLHWNLLEEAEFCQESMRAWSKVEGATNLMVQVLEASDPIQGSIIKGQNPPILGWQNPQPLPGHYKPSPMLTFQISSRDVVTRCLTLLMPFEGTQPPDLSKTDFTCGRNEAFGQHIVLPDGRELWVAASPQLATRIGESDHLESDGALVVIITRNGEPEQWLLVNGMYLIFKDKMLVDHSKAGTYYQNTRSGS